MENIRVGVCIKDEKTGRTYWLEKKSMKEELRFVSAPTHLDGTPDLDQIDYLSDWENMEDFSEDPANFQHLIKILESLVNEEVA
tara:strand:- start:5 stop:256 length:252 start_codon:yes stop_codon:yes gene_type:complete